MTTLTCQLFLITQLLAIPPLSEGDLVQIESATDGDQIVDAPAFYPLVENAATWQYGDETGAILAGEQQFKEILDNPEAARGQLYLISGNLRLIRRQDFNFARTGAWKTHLAEWTVKWGDNPHSAEEVAIILLTNPPATAKVDDQFRIPARFYKIWRTESDQGITDFPVFIGHGAIPINAGAGPVRSTGNNEYMMLLGFVLLLIVAFYVLRSRIRKDRQTAPVTAAAERILRERRAERLDDEEDEGPPLPENPVEALNELQRRHFESAHNEER